MSYRIVDRRGVPFAGNDAPAAPRLGEELAILRSEVLTGTAEITSLDDVVRRKGYRYLRRMLENNAFLDGIWESRTLATLGLGWIVTPASDEARDREIAEFVTAALDRLRGPFSGDIAELLDGIWYGHAISEIVWEEWASPWGRRIVPSALTNVAVENFAYVVDPHGGVTAINQTMPRRQNGLPIDKFVVARWKGQPGDPYGGPTASRLYWEDWFMREGRKFWAIANERFGSPTTTVSYPRTSNTATKTEALKVLDELQASTGIAMSEDIKVAFLESSRSGKSTYGDFQADCQDIIRIRLLGQTLTSGNGDPGSNALGVVHDLVRQDILKADTEWVYSHIQEQLVRRIVAINYAGAAEPTIGARPRDLRDRVQLLPVVESAVRLGVPIGQTWFRETFGIPTPGPDEELLVKPEPLALGPVGDPASDAAGEPHPPTDGQFGNRDARPESRIHRFAAIPSVEAGEGLSRDLTPTETPAVVTAIERVSTDLLASAREEARGIWTEIRDDLVAQVVRKRAIEDRKIAIDLRPKMAGFTDLLTRTYLAANASGRSTAMAELNALGAGITEKFMADGDARLESRTYQFAVGDEIDVLTAVPSNDEAQAWLAGRQPMPKAAWSRLSAEAKQQAWYITTRESNEAVGVVYDAVQEALANGWGVPEFRRQVENRFAVWVGDVFGNQTTLAGADRRIATVLRTNIMHATNAGRDAVFARAENPEYATDPVVAYMYSAIMDGRTRATHAAMDGQVFLANSPVWAKWKPPCGYNCRCYRVPILASKAATMAREAVSTTVPVMDGTAIEPDPGFGASAL